MSAEVEVRREARREVEASNQRQLDALAEQIGQEVEMAERRWRDALDHAIKAGEKLIEAKTLVKHGQWLDWLEQHLPGGARTAQGYMRLAKNATAVAHLGTVREAIAALAQPKPKPAVEPPKPESAPEPLTPEQQLEEMEKREARELLDAFAVLDDVEAQVGIDLSVYAEQSPELGTYALGVMDRAKAWIARTEARRAA